MYSVLLVDDEPTIREGLRTLMPWEEMGYRVIDTAANGEEALEKCKAFIPDLLIADIRMPGMNGLELAKNLRGLELETHILILSGYADFEYAKQAIAYRIDGYLLKPVDEDELTNFLLKLRMQLDQSRTKAESDDAGSIERAVQSLLIEDDQQLTPTSPPPKDSLIWDGYEIVLVRPLMHNDVVSAQQMIIKHKLEVHFNQRERGIVFAMEPYIGILVKNGVGVDRNRKMIYKNISDACLGQVSDFSAAAGGAVQQWSDIVLSYRKSLSLLKNRFFHEGGSFILEESESFQIHNRATVTKNESLLSQTIDSLYLALEVGNVEAAMKLIQEMAERMEKDGYAEEEFKNMFVQLLTSVLDKFSTHRIEIQRLEFRGRIMELHKEQRLVSLLDRINVIAKNIADSLGETGNEKQIKRMINLIHQNFSDNLKLENLAELFNYNSAYLGKLFKQATGDHFNTYLNKIRIEQAKLLLEQGYKVYQVATKVGYANVDYFHAKFRKYAGTSPSCYKKKE